MSVTVRVPASMQTLTNGESVLIVEGHNLRAIIADLARQHPALGNRLQDGDRLGKGLTLSINGDILSTGLITKVEDNAEIAILPQISGGASDDFTVEQLADMYRKGDLQLPVLQRKYVWSTKQVCSLLDSLYRGYPSGSMLRWQAPKGTATKRAAVSTGPGGISPYMLLDGQQRLTALAAVLHDNKVTVKGRTKPIEILFNMDHDDRDNEEMPRSAADTMDGPHEDDASRDDRSIFAPATATLRRDTNWISVTEALHSKRADTILSELGMNSRKDPARKKFLDHLKRLRRILDYRYRMVTIDQSRTYSDVVHIFVRVNSHGTRLSAADLALAQISTIWEAAVDKIENLEDHYGQHGHNFNTSIILRALTIFATDLRQCRFDHLNTLSAKQIERGLDRTRIYLDAAVDLMRNDLGIDHSALLASNFVPIVIASYLWKLDRNPRKAERDQLRKWALLALSWGRYSGSGVPMLEEDIREIRLNHGCDALIARLQQNRGSIKVISEDIADRNMQNPMFKTMLLSFRENDIEDWLDGGKVSWANIGAPQKPNIHHIFPQARLKRNGHPPNEINDLANLAFINAESNQRLSDSSPADYLPRVDPRELRKQCIPVDQQLWQIDAYDDFLKARRKLLTRRLNQFMKVTRTI